MKCYRLLICCTVIVLQQTLLYAQTANPSLSVKKTGDFAITGKGTAHNWANTEWVSLQQRDSKTLRNNQWNIPLERDNITDIQYKTSFKILYSDKGVYCLFSCEDSLITATLKEDYSNIYDEDVVEAFFWPDQAMPLYFEYELSPLNVELPILIVNNSGKIMGWKPWMYTGERKTIHAIHIDENKTAGNRISWTAEIFIPFSLLTPLGNVPPVKGTKWRANFYRIDYDRKPAYTSWQLTRQSYHDYVKFGTIVFE
ncbi:carbohydrate-binding family 9-like protein [Flavihumibacter profundi]|uniref:carbohydrate-binding family 9-like protein n=1 Tax=Flavihumibacter profundi TaxID=2716883 RepID=UPI001CC56D27|nr:carbohydrate-binding family 9-like protein [Flavihumibacter profundi]MBZ5859329.1 carbohydrate-binding family 9-like protein [Flavihumibacter profundi]